MTRTKKTGMRVRGGRLAVVGALGLAAVTAAAVPAFAKGDLAFTAPHTAKVGQTYTVSAHGDDDSASYLRACLQSRTGNHAWHQVSCSPLVATGSDASVTAHVKAAHKGAQEYHAVLYGQKSRTDRHPVVERTSATATVTIR
ncbi:hypothetical protein K7472_27730 [Streptomyces sp. PTM05]|uniref:Secreted protein n=1 Tax=Streptantibioticus parmotrematis TaxID=2873249 RepID=A0ABS7R109_9ACTN|nr:hypothetical protein [Streptantibioticus parmotrematis]MBY8888604.1 hypothetical protein [Streptantibioticus parmotrematis]